MIGTVVIVGLYLYALGPLRKKYHLAERVNKWQAFSFLLGMSIMFLALVSPLDELGDSYLFSAHMVQHMFLTIVCRPLLLLGTPGWLIEPLLRKSIVFRIARILTFPALAFFMYNFDFWLWHVPPLYNATLENQSIHILEHVTFIVFGVITGGPFQPFRTVAASLNGGAGALSLLEWNADGGAGGWIDFFPTFVCSLPGGPAYLGAFTCYGSAIGRPDYVGAGEYGVYCDYECSFYSLDAEAGGEAEGAGGIGG